jgi:hypothetical protein
MTTRKAKAKAEQGRKQIPVGDDNKKSEAKARAGQKQIPFGDDNKKSKSNGKSNNSGKRLSGIWRRQT